MKVFCLAFGLTALIGAGCSHPVSGGSTTVSADSEELRIGGGTIRVVMAPNLSLPKPVIMEWVHRAAVAVTTYLGRYPVKEVLISIKPGGHNAINHGLTQAGSRISVELGRRAKNGDLETDWILTHEMFHLAFPTLPQRYSWMMEGLSDYLEPLARARAGQLSAEEVWKDFVEGLPQGLPEAGDEGLDNTPTWGRTYWGGNLYWLLADIRIREQTGNRRGVVDVIRAILNAGGDGSADWPIEKVLAIGDRATGTKVLTELHNELGPKPVTTDLTALWKQLGVVYVQGNVSFDDSAPLASVRLSITVQKKPIHAAPG